MNGYEHFSPPQICYIPTDYIKYTDATIMFDLTHQDFPKINLFCLFSCVPGWLLVCPTWAITLVRKICSRDGIEENSFTA